MYLAVQPLVVQFDRTVAAVRPRLALHRSFVAKIGCLAGQLSTALSFDLCIDCGEMAYVLDVPIVGTALIILIS